MLLPCGRWNNHMVGMEGRSYCLGGRWNSHRVSYFNLSSLLLIRTSSHKWGRWYLPMSLIQGRTIDPYKHWFFYQPGEVLLLPTHYAEIFKWGSMTCGVAVVIYGGRGPSDALCISLQMFLMFHQCTPHHIPTYHIWICKLNDSFWLCGLYLLVPPIHLSMSSHY